MLMENLHKYLQDNNYLHHCEPFKVFFSYLELKKTIKVPIFKLGFPQIKGIETAYSKESPFSVCLFDNTWLVLIEYKMRDFKSCSLKGTCHYLIRQCV